jgi:DNA-binding NarL/FixJ family response regulator
MSPVARAHIDVLVVDDQDPFRLAMAAVVEETDGFAVVGAVASGEESVAAIAELRPDLVLMDVNLPGIDGIEAARQISAGESPPVVILLSTYDEDDFQWSGCNAAAYLSKAALSPDRLQQLWSAATTQGV